MAKEVTISGAEWEVMNVIWDGHPITSREIVDEVRERKGWRSRTIRTLLDRLVGKGAVRATHDGKRYVYRPAVQRKACLRQESQLADGAGLRGAIGPDVGLFVGGGGPFERRDPRAAQDPERQGEIE